MTQPPNEPAPEVARTLDRQIAERMGWTVRHSKQSDTYAITNADNYLFVANALWQMPMYSHNTFETMTKLGERNTEAEAWNDCPYFTTDLKAAMTLCHNVSFFITSNGGTTLYPDNPAVWVGNGDPVMAASDAPEDIARAIAEAWLAYTAPQQPAAGDVSG